MDYKEIFGEELGTQIEGIVKEKNLTLIVDDKEKPNYIPKDRFNEVIGSKNELKTQVSELTNQLESLKKSAKGNDELTQAIEELKNKNLEWEGKYSKTQIDNAIKLKALHEKAKDPSDLMKFLDYEKLSLNENNEVTGLEEQLKELKEHKNYLFDVEQVQNNNKAMNPSSASVSPKTNQENINEIFNQIKQSPNNKGLMLDLFKRISPKKE